MLKIEKIPFEQMKSHAEATYPNECVGAMLGRNENGNKVVDRSVKLENSAEGSQRAYYQLSNEQLLEADKAARAQDRDLIGIYHSHPDADAYFSETDLKNSCPWYSFVVLSIKGGKYDHSNSWLPDFEQTKADNEELQIGD